MTWFDWLIVLVAVGVVAWLAISTQRYMTSVADFCSASRVAGRYVIANAKGETGMAVVGLVAGFEVFYQAGWTVGWWGFISIPVGMIMVLTGFVVYRYRETRVMTLAQFFEIRYSRGFRLLAGFMAFLSGVVNYGIFPAVASRFFVYFCGLPQELPVGGVTVPTFALVMALYLTVAMVVILSGGQITIMVTDCIEGIMSLVLYFVVIVALLWMFSWTEVVQALAAEPPGHSKINPFDAGQIKDFNLWYVLIGVIGSVYNHMAWQGGHAYNSAAKSPHESKMAAIVGNWRGFGKGLFITLLSIAAYTWLKHPDFAQGAAAVDGVLSKIDNPQIANQMRMPVALGLLLPVGVKGVVCALFVLGLVAADSSYLHSWGTIFVQDVLVPLQKKPFSQKQHLLLLRLAVVGVAVFGFFFSLFYRQTEYIMMFFAITGAIFSGAGAVIIGGLYWKKGTNAAAWCAMLAGSSLAVFGLVVQQPVVWRQAPAFMDWVVASVPVLGDVEAVRAFAANMPAKFPINGVWMNLIAMATATGLYWAVSLLTCREDFNMDRMLHRGRYALDPKAEAAAAPARKGWSVRRFLGVDHQYSRGDKVISYSLFGWKMFWMAVGVVITLWNLVLFQWPLSWWSTYWQVHSIYIPFVLAVPTTIWFVWGGISDIRRLFRDLKSVTRREHDDGTVVGHQNLDEAEGAPVAK